KTRPPTPLAGDLLHQTLSSFKVWNPACCISTNTVGRYPRDMQVKTLGTHNPGYAKNNIHQKHGGKTPERSCYVSPGDFEATDLGEVALQSSDYMFPCKSNSYKVPYVINSNTIMGGQKKFP